MSEREQTPRSKGFDRPCDPAGTRPKVDPALLRAAPLNPPVIDSDAEEIAAEAQEQSVAAPALATPLPAAPSTDVALAPAAGGLSVAFPAQPHADRFQFILGGLIALGLSAIAAIVLILGNGRDPIPPPWSRWVPSGNGIAGVHEIATHVGAEYRGADGGQLVAVSGTPQEIAGVPVQVAVRTSPSAKSAIPVYNGTGVIYQLCGLGAKCAINVGQVSTQRHLLLRREALELALYTFRYVGGVDQVEVFMPSRKGKSPTQVLFFRASQLSAELDLPITATLRAQTPTVSTVAQSADSALIDKVTSASLYAFTLASQNGSEFLVLQQL